VDGSIVNDEQSVGSEVVYGKTVDDAIAQVQEVLKELINQQPLLRCNATSLKNDSKDCYGWIKSVYIHPVKWDSLGTWEICPTFMRGLTSGSI